MTALQFRAALSRLGVSQLEIARRLGLGARTVRRYAAGDAEIPEPTAILLRLLASGKVSLGEL